MLTVYGLLPVWKQASMPAPVWGRSEEERLLWLLPVACPLETYYSSI